MAPWNRTRIAAMAALAATVSPVESGSLALLKGLRFRFGRYS